MEIQNRQNLICKGGVCVGGVVGWGGVLEPWAMSDFLGKSWEKSWEILEPVAKSGNYQQGILGFLHHRTASFAGAPITPREEAGSLSCDSAACED